MKTVTIFLEQLVDRLTFSTGKIRVDVPIGHRRIIAAQSTNKWSSLTLIVVNLINFKMFALDFQLRIKCNGRLA